MKVVVTHPEYMEGEVVTIAGERFPYPGGRFWVYPVIKLDGTKTLITAYAELPQVKQPLLWTEKELKELTPDPIWEPGRAFVLAESGVIEYFCKWEYYEGKHMIRSFCGGLRDAKLCRPLDYICDPKYLKDSNEAI